MIDPTVAADRAIAVYHLRHNPKNFIQSRGHLLTPSGARCALGVIADAFDILVFPESEDMEESEYEDNNSAYEEIKRRLDLDEISIIWHWNDTGSNFRVIASFLEDHMRTFGMRTDDADDEA